MYISLLLNWPLLSYFSHFSTWLMEGYFFFSQTRPAYNISNNKYVESFLLYLHLKNQNQTPATKYFQQSISIDLDKNNWILKTSIYRKIVLRPLVTYLKYEEVVEKWVDSEIRKFGIKGALFLSHMYVRLFCHVQYQVK